MRNESEDYTTPNETFNKWNIIRIASFTSGNSFRFALVSRVESFQSIRERAGEESNLFLLFSPENRREDILEATQGKE